MLKFTAVSSSVALACCAVWPMANAAPVSLRYIGQQTLETGRTFSDAATGVTEIGGLSGIDYNQASNTFVAISDDRSQTSPARFYSLQVGITPSSFQSVTFTGATTLKRPDGSTFPALSLDPEAIRRSNSGNLFWTSEGDANAGINPFVRSMQSNGSYVSELTLPGYYAASGTAGTTGIRNNLAFESLAFSPDGTRLYTATENALKQDGPAAGVGVGSAARILAFNAATGAPVAEYVYNVGPVAQNPEPLSAFATNGLTELLAVSDKEFLAIERSFSTGAPGTGNVIRIYSISLEGATDVLGRNSLTGTPYTPVNKTLVLDLSTLNIPLDNIEGMTFGPTLSNGAASLFLVSDNNFSGTQFTQFLAFEVNPVPLPGTYALLGAGLLGGLFVRNRKSVQTRQPKGA